MSEFHVGQEVVCVDDVPLPGRWWPNGAPVKHGAHYTVRAVLATHLGNPGIRLEETTFDALGVGCDLAIACRRFHPIRAENIAIFREMCKAKRKKLLNTK